MAAALITAHATTHAPSRNATPRAEKVKRPTITSAGTTEDWQYFQSRWSDYVRATKLEGTDKIIQLLECCDEQLRKDLTRNAGGTLTEMTEDEVFAAMRRLAVREENTMVARVTLHNMRQDRDEPIRAYGARLRGQASVCKFTQQCAGCDATVNYTEGILRDVLSRGLADSEIQMDLLGNKNQDMTLEEVLKFVEAKEAGKRSASRLLLPHTVDAVTGSSYRQQKKTTARGPPPPPKDLSDQEPCTYCGQKGHGRSAPTKVRRKQCPAFGTSCSHCNRSHHYGKMCRRKNDPKEEGEHESSIFDTLCEVTSCGGTGRIALGHHVFDQSTDQWHKRQSKAQPFVRLSMSTHREDYEHFGFEIPTPPTSAFVSAMADTGCQSCLAGFKVLKKLGLSTKDLIPVELRMHAADNHDIQLLGAAILRLTGKNHDGKERTTRQIVYVTNNTDKLFLSREACADLGIISHQFPLTGEAPAYPFQCICADYFHYQGFNYLVIVDRYSNWPIVERAQEGAKGLINTLRKTFATYGIPDELATDGGPEFVAHLTRKFLGDWGIHHRLSSVAFPHSNCRAEIGVKTIKRLITDNVGKNGDINVDSFQRAILQYRNTPDHVTKLSPAICIFGRPTKDLIPILPGKYNPHPTWRESLATREDALRNRHMIHHERWKEHTKALPPLQVGDHVRIQNQTGHHPTKWDKTGIVVQVHQYHQYTIKIDGSNRTTLRNRKFLRKYTPVYQPPQRRSILDDLACLPPPPSEQSPDHSQTPAGPPSPPSPSHELAQEAPQSPQRVIIQTPTSTSVSPPNLLPTAPTLDHTPAGPTSSPAPRPQPTPPRRSTRATQPPAWLNSGDYILS